MLLIGERATLAESLVRTMQNKLWGIIAAIRNSFWFLPSVMCGAAIALSFLMLKLDENIAAKVIDKRDHPGDTGNAEALRQIQSRDTDG